MRIAILGATSHIAKDLIQLLSVEDGYELALFARRPQLVLDWMSVSGIKSCQSVCDFSSFKNDQHFDALINFVGVGDPAVAQSMGAAILDLTHEFDSLALNYLKKNPDTRYLFLSSGAAYGSNFSEAARPTTPSCFDINILQTQDWYGIAKFYAECRHRAFSDLSIVDIRVFSYFSASQNPAGRFLMSDILRSLKTREVFFTSTENIVRDYLGPQDFKQMLGKILHSEPINVAVDCYTQQPAEKFALLDALRKKFGLSYQINPSGEGINATGSKQNYYSTNHRAHMLFGYSPALNSIETVLKESEKFLTL